MAEYVDFESLDQDQLRKLYGMIRDRAENHSAWAHVLCETMLESIGAVKQPARRYTVQVRTVLPNEQYLTSNGSVRTATGYISDAVVIEAELESV